jgi:hypothetical protein
VKTEITDLFLPARRFEYSVRDTALFDAIVADLRPVREWIQGMPTFDVSDGSWLYAPRYRRPVNVPKRITEDMTVVEYRDYFHHLPVLGATRPEQETSWRALVRWADADPRRWTLYPAALELCGSLFSLSDTTQSREHCGR